MDRESLTRIWFGGVRAASDAGEAEIPKSVRLSPLQRAKLRILLRRDACNLLTLCIQSAEHIPIQTAKEIWERVYTGLMEDAVAGVWSGEENLELVRFLGLCSEGIGAEEDFCDCFRLLLGMKKGAADEKTDAAAVQAKRGAQKSLDAFIKERKRLKDRAASDDGPPPGLDEFEYIDWQITH